MKNVKRISARSLTFDEFHTRMAKPITTPKANGYATEKIRRTFKLNGVIVFSMREVTVGNGERKLVEKVTSVNRRCRKTKVWLNDQRVITEW